MLKMKLSTEAGAVKEIREKYGCSMQEAKRIALTNALNDSIKFLQSDSDIKEIKEVLLNIVSFIHHSTEANRGF